LWLLVAMGWSVLHAYPTLAQVADGISPPTPSTIHLNDETENATDNVGQVDEMDDILGLLDAPLEDLARQDVVVPALDVEVSTVSRRTSTVGHSPAAVYVVTGKMIRRSGARSIPEVLRMVPGVEVARTTANRWAVTSRGFNGSFANKLLVQIDGRSVYSPIFAGTYWEAQNLPLENIQRIEVIRGPGATVWGANAVNGVINIITKNSQDTLGVLVNVGGGTEERDFATVQYGGRLGAGATYRVYGQYLNRDRAFSPTIANDNWRLGQGGFRMDWDLDSSQTDVITVQGDYYDGQLGNVRTVPSLAAPFQETVRERLGHRGANLLARWEHVSSDESDYGLQVYYDWVQRHNIVLTEQDVHTLDIDFQHRFQWTANQQLVWGMGYRSVAADTLPSTSLVFAPASRHTDLYSAFVQDEITLLDDRLYFTLGCKGEHNSFTDFEFQPTARLLFLPSDRASAWGAVSRAVRTPSIVEANSGFLRLIADPPLPPFLHPIIRSNPSFGAEEVMAYELGYRAQPTDAFSWDLALFYNVYHDLRTFDVASVIPPVFPVSNRMHGESYGAELACALQLTPRWRLRGNYSFLQLQLHAAPGTLPTSEDDEGKSPHNQVYLQSSWDLPCCLEFDLIARYVDILPTYRIPSYISLDLRFGWHPRENLEFAVVGQSLLDDDRFEFDSDFFRTQNTGLQRGVYGMVTLRQ